MRKLFLSQEIKQKGGYIKSTVAGEAIHAYVPPFLPLREPPFDAAILLKTMDKAHFYIKQLGVAVPSLFEPQLMTFMQARKEALLSSQIEGTQSSMHDLLLFENAQKPNMSIDDVEEVSNYVKAVRYGMDKIDEGFPLCVRLMKELHAILMDGIRGGTKAPGQFRQSQNWIGGTRPGNAFFVPPPPEYVGDLMANLEGFIHDDETSYLTNLIKASMMHVQFETIHPFLDGNGRLGRLLITLFLYASKEIDGPTLFLSYYLKKHRQTYYQLLNNVRSGGGWTDWLLFFFEGIIESAQETLSMFIEIQRLIERDQAVVQKAIKASGATQSVYHVWRALLKCPQGSVDFFAKECNISAPTSRQALNHLVECGIIHEITGQKRDKIYLYRAYLDILEKDTKPL